MQLSAAVESTLASFVESAREAFGDELESIVLFGSAAENRLRASSDVNVVLVLRRFEPERAARLAGAAAHARAAVRLSPMFVQSSELADCAELFAAKFADIARRHRVLFGRDPFEQLALPRAAQIGDLRELLTNLMLRMRVQYVAGCAQPDRFVPALANASGPLRVAAATLLALEGRKVAAPREALAELAAQAWGDGARARLAWLSEARENGYLPAGEGAITLAKLLELVGELRARAAKLG